MVKMDQKFGCCPKAEMKRMTFENKILRRIQKSEISHYWCIVITR